MWPGRPPNRVHHVEHYPVLGSRGDRQAVIVVIRPARAG